MRRRWLLLTLALTACQPSSDNAQTPEPTVTLREFVAGSMAQITDEQAGRPLLINFWSLECAPCREEMPRIAALKRDHPDLPVLLVATDGMAARDAITAALRESGLDSAENWVFAEEFVEKLRYEVDPGWYGELPRTFLYASDGTRVAISGTLSEDVLRQWVAATTAPR